MKRSVACVAWIVLGGCGSSGGKVGTMDAAVDAFDAVTESAGQDDTGGGDGVVGVVTEAGRDGLAETGTEVGIEAGRDGLVEAGMDAGGGRACTSPADCMGLQAEPSGHFACGDPSWSCIARRCTQECQGGRTCDIDASGCVGCLGDSSPRQCPTDSCAIASPSPTVERMSCASAPDVKAWTCFGSWARLPDGTLCSLESLPTALIRWAVSCGGCQTILVE